MTQPFLPSRLSPLLLVLLALFILMLQGCKGKDGWDFGEISDADPGGYYYNGGGTVQGGAIAVTDLQAIVHGDRIMMMSTANELLYDGQITNVSGNDFTADFIVYTGGENPVEATASGTITQGSNITGTLSGEGVGSGTFTLLYATTNDEVADISRIQNGNIGGVLFTWGAMVGGESANADFEFKIDENGGVVDDVNSVQGLFHACQMSSGSIIPIVGTNLYEVNAELITCINVTDTTVRMSYTGLATTRNEPGTDETLVFMMTSGSHSFSNDFQ